MKQIEGTHTTLMEFGFKELLVWKKSVEFADKVFDAIEQVDFNRNHFRLVEQLEGSTVSVSNNIAEGKGRKSKKEFIQFLYIASGSLYEAVSILTIFKKRNWIDDNVYQELEMNALELVRMLKGLINSLYKN